MKYGIRIAAVVLATWAASAALAADQSKSDEATAILAQMKREEAGVWDISARLEKLGPEVAPLIEQQLDTLTPPYKVAAARVLCRIGSVARGVKALVEVVRDQPDSPVALDAAQLLGDHGRSQAEGDLVHLLDSAKATSLRIALARALWSAATTEESWEKANTTLRETFRIATGEDRKEGALALAEINDFSDEVLAVLEQLQVEPGHRGGEARAVLDLKKLRDNVRNAPRAENSFQDAILREVLLRLQTFHVDKPKTFEDYRNAAAKGMAAALDPFTGYYDAKEYNEFRENMTGEYAGIGAKVGFLGEVDDPENRTFSVIRPIYSGPAYRAGMRSYDEIVAVDGKPAKGRELQELVDSLKGIAGTTVNVTIRRQSEPEEKVLAITRETVKLQSAYFKMLPGSLGYVKLLHFGNDAVKEFGAAVDELEAAGMKALVVDLRNNPGGLLQGAVDIADMFLKDDKLIVRSEGRDPRIVPEERFVTADPATHPDYPLVLLVNGNSASASEIVAGALQDYHRATLIGERTYGKGSVQRLMELESDGKRSALKVTIAKYYLPSGRSIHRTHTDRGGVKPDIEIEQEAKLDSRDSAKFEEIRSAGSFDAYTSKLLEPSRQLLEQLAEYDGNDWAKYPGFDQWYDGLKVPITKDSARVMLRAWVRIKLGDETGNEYFVDLQDDTQLARAVAETMSQLGRKDELETIEVYKGLARRFKLDKQ